MGDVSMLYSYIFGSKEIKRQIKTPTPTPIESPQPFDNDDVITVTSTIVTVITPASAAKTPIMKTSF
ncbi:unnamed protein product [Rhizophagus irregularis]|nr:unnamed protein product [Rhizophagus irregularis]